MFRTLAVIALATGFALLSPSTSDASPQAIRGVIPGWTVDVQIGRPAPPDAPRGFTRQWRPGRPGRAQEPATARGYTDGYRRGRDDGRDHERYDPVGHGAYRTGDPGYRRDYGSRDAYKNNYRAGFRQGYDDGYREGTRGRR